MKSLWNTMEKITTSSYMFHRTFHGCSIMKLHSELHKMYSKDMIPILQDIIDKTELSRR